MITTEQVKELRDKTGVSVMQCKKALEEAGGDMEKALIILNKKSGEIAAKKSDRETDSGLIVSKKSGSKVALVSLKCETDFVAKNSDFENLANMIADKALSEGKEKAIEDALDIINPVIQKIGENIKLGEIEVVEGPVLGTYIHNGKSGVVVSLSLGTENLAKDIAMHVAAMKPEYIRREDIPEQAKKMTEEVFQNEVMSSDKPEEIKKKILAGKIETYFKEKTLLDQPFIKDSNITISELLVQNSKNSGGNIEIKEILQASVNQ